MQDRPVAQSADAVLATWALREHDPEMACAPAWSEACRSWWHHPTDARLRQRTLDQLYLTRDEFPTWSELGWDEASLVRAHGHVIAMRAGLERATQRRTLVTGALRTTPVVTYQRSGHLVTFSPPEELARRVAEFAKIQALLPDHPFARAASICHAICSVHPFPDANGGSARFLASLELARGWLPPFVVSPLQRNTSYIEAVVQANVDLSLLLRFMHDIAQQELGALLLGGTAAAVAWDEASGARADRWIAIVDAAWRTATGLPVVADAAAPGALARLARRGYRLPRAHGRLVRWASVAPVPTQLDLVLARVPAGDDVWTVASVAASVGDDGELGTLLPGEPIASVFVAPPTESEATATARFERWLARRIDQCVRGLASWM